MNTLKGESAFGERRQLVSKQQANTVVPDISAPLVRVSSAPLSLLVVDDNNANRVLMNDTLTALGHTVTLAVDGNAAIEHVARKQFNLILMDMRMPGMDGIEATRRIRSLEQDAGRTRTPVIVITADADFQTQEACRLAGIDALLTKPAPLNKLTAIIAEQTSGINGIACGKTAPDDQPLLTLQTLGDMENKALRIRKFTDLLLADIQEEMSNLKAALQAQDRQALEQAAHTLKGLCGHLRDPILKDQAMLLQAGAQSADLPPLQTTADLLQGAVNTIITQRRKPEAL
jgi:CheY-like chemotaxis protein